MSTGTRLILLLTVMVGAVLLAASIFILRERETALQHAMHDEVRAHALTLQIALEQHYAADRIADAEQLINRLRQNTSIYGVILFDASGEIAMLSVPQIAEEIKHPPELEPVIRTGVPAEFVRLINGQEVFSIILPVHVGATWRGAFEISQPLSFVKDEIARTRRNFIIMSLVLLATIFLVVLMVTRYSISRPIAELLGGAQAVGEGDLDYRVIVPRSGGELAQLAREFNRMADQLTGQRRAAARAAEQRLALERELRHSERLAAVGRLAAGVAHEMGAPLNVIDGRAEQLLARPDAAVEARQRNLTIIRAQVARITRIVRQLLNLARPYNLRREPVELSRLVASTIEQIETDAARKGVVMEVTASERIIVEADQEFLRQVLLNIAMNAIQAMPAGGRLRIAYQQDAAVRDGRRFAAIRVSDTGAGIAPEHLPNIFDPFYTTKEVGQGTGLGLAVSRRIVEEHGGWIEAMNNPERGATFVVYLAAAEPLAASADNLLSRTKVQTAEASGHKEA